MNDEYRFIEQDRKSIRDLIQYLVIEDQPELLAALFDLLQHSWEWEGRLSMLKELREQS